jgi:hypothetical protein
MKPIPETLIEESIKRLNAGTAEIDRQISRHVRTDLFWDFARLNVRDSFGYFTGGWGLLGYSPRMAAYACLADVIDAYSVRRLYASLNVAQSCGWWWPFPHLCVVSERPSAVHTDASGRLHNAREAALQYRDGYALHVWHGTRIYRD